MALLPVFVIVNTALPMAKYFGGSDELHGWQMTMIIYAGGRAPVLRHLRDDQGAGAAASPGRKPH